MSGIIYINSDGDYAFAPWHTVKHVLFYKNRAGKNVIKITKDIGAEIKITEDMSNYKHICDWVIWPFCDFENLGRQVVFFEKIKEFCAGHYCKYAWLGFKKN